MAELKFILAITIPFIYLLILVRFLYLKFGYIEFATGKKKITLKDFFCFYKN